MRPIDYLISFLMSVEAVHLQHSNHWPMKWDTTIMAWKCFHCGFISSTDHAYNTQVKKIVCTCGSEKTFGEFTGHSDWCDKMPASTTRGASNSND